LYSGLKYAAQYSKWSYQAGIDIRTETQVTDWHDDNSVTVTSPSGRYQIVSKAILLATGCREKSRAARFIPGDRPHGVYTTGILHRLLSMGHKPTGKNAVVVGVENVSYSAVYALQRSGTQVAAIITEHPYYQTNIIYRMLAVGLNQVPVYKNSKVTKIIGNKRVNAVEVTNVVNDSTQNVLCDTVIFTGEWIPDNELIRLGGFDIDPNTRGPRVDQYFRTSRNGVFASGNILHGGEPASIAALEGKYVTEIIVEYLKNQQSPQGKFIDIEYCEPIKWIFPSRLNMEDPNIPSGKFSMRVNKFIKSSRIKIHQGEKIIRDGIRKDFIPNHSIYFQDNWLSRIDLLENENISISLE
jgi:thioredoxin reductase